ncbi:hypothetical protein EVA_18514, partial [gut metagenome]
MRKFEAFTISKTQIGLKFLEPADAQGVMIRMSGVDYPKTPNDGTIVLDNNVVGKYENKEYVVKGLKHGQTYYFSAFPYSDQGVFNFAPAETNRNQILLDRGETINVAVTIDDASGFTRVLVKCVDETNALKTKTATITPTNLKCSFEIPAGDTYHLEFGKVEGYS